MSRIVKLILHSNRHLPWVTAVLFVIVLASTFLIAKQDKDFGQNIAKIQVTNRTQTGFSVVTTLNSPRKFSAYLDTEPVTAKSIKNGKALKAHFNTDASAVRKVHQFTFANLPDSDKYYLKIVSENSGGKETYKSVIKPGTQTLNVSAQGEVVDLSTPQQLYGLVSDYAGKVVADEGVVLVSALGSETYFSAPVSDVGTWAVPFNQVTSDGASDTNVLVEAYTESGKGHLVLSVSAQNFSAHGLHEVVGLRAGRGTTAEQKLLIEGGKLVKPVTAITAASLNLCSPQNLSTCKAADICTWSGGSFKSCIEPDLEFTPGSLKPEAIQREVIVECDTQDLQVDKVYYRTNTNCGKTEVGKAVSNPLFPTENCANTADKFAIYPGGCAGTPSIAGSGSTGTTSDPVTLNFVLDPPSLKLQSDFRSVTPNILLMVKTADARLSTLTPELVPGESQTYQVPVDSYLRAIVYTASDTDTRQILTCSVDIDEQLSAAQEALFKDSTTYSAITDNDYDAIFGNGGIGKKIIRAFSGRTVHFNLSNCRPGLPEVIAAQDPREIYSWPSDAICPFARTSDFVVTQWKSGGSHSLRSVMCQRPTDISYNLRKSSARTETRDVTIKAPVSGTVVDILDPLETINLFGKDFCDGIKNVNGEEYYDGGFVVLIADEQGNYWRFAHMDEDVLQKLKEGGPVKQGDVIGSLFDGRYRSEKYIPYNDQGVGGCFHAERGSDGTILTSANIHLHFSIISGNAVGNAPRYEGNILDSNAFIKAKCGGITSTQTADYWLTNRPSADDANSGCNPIVPAPIEPQPDPVPQPNPEPTPDPVPEPDGEDDDNVDEGSEPDGENVPGAESGDEDSDQELEVEDSEEIPADILQHLGDLKEYDFSLVSGWNAFGIPYYNQDLQSASDFYQKLVEASGGQLNAETDLLLAKLETNGNYSTYTLVKVNNTSITDFPVLKVGGDFDISPGDSLLIYSKKPTKLTLAGKEYISAPDTELKTGWNMITNLEPVHKNASDLLASDKANLRLISRLNSGVFMTLVQVENQTFGNDFALNENEGYIVYLKNSATD